MGRRAERGRGLPRMAPLQPATAVLAAADGDLEFAHRRTDDGHVDLQLPRCVGRSDGTGTVRTGCGQRHADRFVDARWPGPRRPTTIGRGGFAARAPRATRKIGSLETLKTDRRLWRGKTSVVQP